MVQSEMGTKEGWGGGLIRFLKIRERVDLSLYVTLDCTLLSTSRSLCRRTMRAIKDNRGDDAPVDLLQSDAKKRWFVPLAHLQAATMMRRAMGDGGR